MKYSIMVEYALHSLTYLIDLPKEQPIGIKDLAEFQGLSETYLSKVFGKLSKAGIVKSVPGVKGGYSLASAPDTISFLDVVNAVEGVQPIFQCQNILRHAKESKVETRCADCTVKKTPCIINLTMLAAEQQMHAYLQGKTLAWLHSELDVILSPERRAEIQQFFIK
ncbi:RrF2 family transcriptional regulator [Kurthia sibirica]|uniref:Rrf2 family transcriptional regulator n=1 Tax=Kurthia sibirica TaxID=202750 RepID=A0A2U3APD6_9BACL|nr:Rrf2 family transcriptional regulator [Kurthia sibirica]PWI26315.1 Rrf2 family transcriptional regulator [Kurthia sibirica]GEK35016.1 Rrf2 family transcriptional regulator [Kurthia sibirica]